MSSPQQTSDAGLGSARAGLLVLAVAVFAAVTTELVPVGLLPQIGSAFHVSTSAAGLLVSAYAVMVAVLSVPLALATRRLSRKPVLLTTIGGYVVSNVIAALAPTFGILAAGRIVGGITHALFFSVCIGYAARLVPTTQTGRAMALASVGVSGGLVLGIPLSTALGEALGWRAAFGTLAVLVALVLVLAAVVLPPVEGTRHDDPPHPGRRRDLATVVVANGLTYLGTYVLYTYISFLLLDSGVARRWLAPTLLLFGLSGLVGLRLAAAQLDHRPRSSAILVPVLMAGGAGAVALAYPHLAPVMVAGMVWLTAFGPAASLYQSASVRTSASTPETAGAWINASSNAGIAGGAAFGGVVMAESGLTWVAWASAVIVAGSAALALLSVSAFPPDTRHGSRDHRQRRSDDSARRTATRDG